MGNSKSGMDFALKMGKEFYYAGDSVQGQLYINAKKQTPCVRIVIEIEGIQSCEFTSQENEVSKGYKKLINSHYILREFPPKHVLRGQYEFPFSFQFLQFLPGSFNQTKGYKAQVIYTIKAIIQSSFQNNDFLQQKLQIVIREPQREGEKTLFGQTFAAVRSCFCLNKGVSRVSCYFDKNYYFPKQQCIMICQVDNTKCGLSISRIQCKFIKEVTLTALNGTSRVFKEQLNTVYFPGIAANESYFGQNAKRLFLKLNQKDKTVGIAPSTHGNYVRCEYYILVEPHFSGCFNKVAQKEFKVRVQILQPSMEYQPIVQPDNWRPSVEQPSNFCLNFQPSNDLLSSMSAGKGNNLGY